MQATISKWGNSLALRLPKHVADQVRLVEGAVVTLEVDDGTLKIIPSRKRFKLSELLAGEPDRAKRKPAEFDWGKPSGDEVW
ncbi:MAG: AbrB/MazE/SpoVT family DNA-binding domain-containing protein [Bacteroidota bacterium]|jgi:antitoxin MazE